MFWCSAGLFDTANEKIKSSAIEPYWIDLILTLRCTHNPCRPWSFAVYLRTPGHPDRLDFSVLPFWRALICRQRRQRRHCPLRQRRRRRCRRRPWWTCMLVFLWYLCLCQTEILPVGVIRWLDDSILHLHIYNIYIYIYIYKNIIHLVVSLFRPFESSAERKTISLQKTEWIQPWSVRRTLFFCPNPSISSHIHACLGGLYPVIPCKIQAQFNPISSEGANTAGRGVGSLGICHIAT